MLQSGQVSDVLTDASDLRPTLAEATAASLPRDVTLDGRSLWPALRGEATAERPWMFAEHKGRYFVRDRRRKLYADGQLFDMHADPDEESPVVERSPGESQTGESKTAAGSRRTQFCTEARLMLRDDFVKIQD
jgi:arylsulfatase A-like enzyme